MCVPVWCVANVSGRVCVRANDEVCAVGVVVLVPTGARQWWRAKMCWADGVGRPSGCALACVIARAA